MKYILVGRQLKDTFPPVSESLIGIEANGRYCPNSRAPTMGTSHCHSEFKTVWSTERTEAFERLTAVNYIKVLMEEFRWGDLEPFEIRIIPVREATP